MSSPVFTARTDWTIPRAARELRRRHVKQLPVVGDDGLLTGIVSRIDLLDTFIRSDIEIRGEVEQDVLGRILGLDEGSVAVDVRDGDVTLRGHVPEPRLVPVILGLCQGVDGVDGVVAVDAHPRRRGLCDHHGVSWQQHQPRADHRRRHRGEWYPPTSVP
ncbi:CBS domain-containing protein [Streptomyces sp. NPDC048825]|uniref:CBS domain-containing protein n=1 Tax=Streptomyces sp. NPDC048825 TaxID=3365592 RepID=UPI00371E1D74